MELLFTMSRGKILGRRYEDTGKCLLKNGLLFSKIKMRTENRYWRRNFPCKDIEASVALLQNLLDKSLQGKAEKISVTSYPIVGRAGGFLGAVAIFWRPE